MSSEFVVPSIATINPSPSLGGATSHRSVVRYCALLAVALLTFFGDTGATILHSTGREPLAPLGIPTKCKHKSTGFLHPNSVGSTSARETALHAQRWKYTRVTLLKDTPHVGKEGDVAIVNRNYAFNYLVPFGFARYTTRAELVGIALNVDYKKALTNVRKASAVDMKTRFGKDLVLHFNVPAETAKSDKLLSPLLPIDIISKLREMKMLLAIDMLREQDVEILSGGGVISTFGLHKVNLNVDPEINIEVSVDVTEKSLDSSFIKDVKP